MTAIGGATKAARNSKGGPGRRSRSTERQTSTAVVYDRLKAMILDNELPPGSFVLQEELAERLGVSRTPVREALIRLEKEGLIEIRPRHGMRVLPVSGRAMQEIYEVLTALEGLAAELVARRGIASAELARLEAAVGDMDKALAHDDLDAWSEADGRFHRILVELTHNSRLIGMVATVLDQAHRVRRLTLRLRPKPVNSNKDHRALVEAIRAGDGARAGAIHSAHRRASGAMLVALLERLEDSGRERLA
jgi:DNA-binding GntR family transcriptional regulator